MFLVALSEYDQVLVESDNEVSLLPSCYNISLTLLGFVAPDTLHTVFGKVVDFEAENCKIFKSPENQFGHGKYWNVCEN